MFRLGLTRVLLFVLLASILAPVSSVSAQETGTLTLNLGTRRVIGTAPSASVKLAQPEGAVSSWAGFSYSPVLRPDFLLDGMAPDGGDGVSFLSWSGVAAGAHTITVPAMLSTYEFTSNAGDATTLWGVLFDAYIPGQPTTSAIPTTNAVAPETAVDTTPVTTPVPSAISAPKAGVTVTALPVAGVGPAFVRDIRFLGVMIAVLPDRWWCSAEHSVGARPFPEVASSIHRACPTAPCGQRSIRASKVRGAWTFASLTQGCSPSD